ncbi:hypothetical protein RM844_17275 [Streptomyces sp. DSM 44915]|uniref:Nucleotidyltransferase domain-containing protein n=1 Tax=Streptomyces chisholmiae TaxID=3075540 RepID=A0ABU2JSR4_9ACTN|nr:hypothetical protein [Streptomyces sp. DSM 44915]MDT0268035.1 hypothetical protein [Streptomyces sp. DSM 44915]
MSRPQPVPATPALDAFLARAHAEPTVLGLVLSGSQVHDGMPTGTSDHDLHVVVAPDAADWITASDGFRSAELDLVVMTLDEFRRRGHPGDGWEWARYAYVHARVLLDRLGGGIGEILDRKRRLTPDERASATDGYLDAYTNQTYRSLKSFRDGRPEAGRWDAAESVPLLWSALFALHGRVRPYNKYLRWELTRQPLGAGRWAVDPLLATGRRLLTTGDPALQREVFGAVEELARAAGHGAVLDSWGADLTLLRPPGAAPA